MDPYLEQYWRDVHHRLCTYACDAIQPQVRPALLARLEERLIAESPIADLRAIVPDIKVVQPPGRALAPDISVAAVSDEPLVLRIDSEQATEGFIQIIDPATGGTVVTVIEFLSTSNKFPGRGQKDYLRKQQELWSAGVSLVEIDLLRTGDWVLLAPEYGVPPSYRTPYRVCVHRGWKDNELELYRLSMDQRLPVIRIPLRPQDQDAKLDLQAIVDQTYENGAYDSIDYSVPPVPHLTADVDRWSDELLRQAGRR
jgi:hypothetical protein